MIAAGGSAGGHLATAIYTTPGCDSEEDDLSISPKPNLFVLYNPVLDATRRPERFASAEVSMACSPLHNMDGDMPPALLMYGTEDLFMEDGKQYIQEARSLGLPAFDVYIECPELFSRDGHQMA